MHWWNRTGKERNMERDTGKCLEREGKRRGQIEGRQAGTEISGLHWASFRA